MSKRIQPWLLADFGGRCSRCCRAVEKGEMIVHGTRRGIWCNRCAQHPLMMVTNRDGRCTRCDLEFQAGELIGWAPRTGLLCFYCAKGKDSRRAELSAEDRTRLDEAYDTVQRLSTLGGRSLTAELELQNNLHILRTKFHHIRAVQQILGRFN
jgi:hypothetical protein